MYYAYENWTVERTPRATIHRAECSDCNDGKGKHPGASDLHGKWHGPFVSVTEAENAMQDPKRRVSHRDVTMRRCKRCSP